MDMANETRHAELRAELNKLYAQSAAATHPEVIREIERQISCLEGDAASLLTGGCP